MLAAAFTLTNCAKDINEPQASANDIPNFELIASVAETKTVNDGMKTNWVAGDAINVFHAVGETTTYTSDGKFTISADNLSAGKFLGTVSGLDPEKDYDWFAFYPYSSYIQTPANTGSGYMPVGSQSNEKQTQNGNNSMAHIAGANYPIAGYAVDVPGGSTPKLIMSHVSSLLEVVVTNAVDTPLEVSNVAFTAPTDIIGTYYINFTGEITPASFKSSGDTYVTNTAILNVKNGIALTKGESARFYLAVKPFEAAANSSLTVSVNGYSKTINPTASV